MKRSSKDIIGFTIGATDGEIGKVKDLYFDDHSWTIRYLVVETGSWLFGRKVLLSPQALLTPEWDHERFPVKLTKDQVKHSPDIDTDKPVSRQEEMKLYEHYPWTYYYPGSLWGNGIGTTGMVMPVHQSIEEALQHEKVEEGDNQSKNPHLRSTNLVNGYTIKATDDNIGEVEDYIFDEETWKIIYLVVDTGHWFPGKKVLISPGLIKDIQWETSSVNVNTTVENVKNSPEYDPENMPDKGYDADFKNHYSQTI